MTLSVLRSALATILAVILVPAPCIAGIRTAGQRDMPNDAVTIRQGGAITGTAWLADNMPAAHARLRLRDVKSGRVVMKSQADANGRYTFAPVRAGTYVVELVDDEGALLGLSQVVGVSPGETAATLIRLGTQVPWYSGFFTNAAAAVLATATSLGVIAIGEGGQPASARN